MSSTEGDRAPHLDDPKLLKIVNKAISTPQSRSILAGASKSAAVTSQGSGSLASSANSAAALEAAAEVTKHLNAVLGDENASIAELSLSKFLGKVERLKESRISEPEGGFPKFQPPAETWRFIALAAQHSSASYRKPPPDDNSHISVKPRNVLRHVKAGTIQVVSVQSVDIIVVSFRGTATQQDWLVNFNDVPYDDAVLTSDSSRRCHRGFQESFKASEDEIAKGITKMVARHPQIRRLLFTGHSAGGAIAQLCYDACSSASSGIGKAVSDLEQIDCITFGTPPITSTPIAPLSPSVFLAFMNEGDPVVLAQPSSIKALLDVYVYTTEAREKLYPNGYVAPAAGVHPSGFCVVLRETSEERDTDEESEVDVLEALEVPAETVERALFGDVSAHFMALYLERVEALADAAGNGGETL